MPLYNLAILAIEAAVYFTVLAALLHFRGRIGIGVFMTVLGTMHFLETYLAARFYVELPFGSVSPGSAMLFSGKLVMILILYIREDATTVRPLIYGLLVGNFLSLLFGITLGLHAGDGPDGGVPASSDFLQQMGVLMVWGTTLLYIDAIAIILIYERLGKWIGRGIALRMFLASSATLAFDQIGFYGALHYLTGAPTSVFWAGLGAKVTMAALYTAMAWIYLTRFPEEKKVSSARRLSDVFNDLTYREKYDELLSRSGIDPLTGLEDRSRLDRDGTDLVRSAIRGRKPVSVMVIDADHFKSVNDRFGHLEGDAVLQRIAEVLSRTTRSQDRVYRFGGEEFVVLTMGADASQALSMAERIRLGVLETVTAGEGASVTVSIGVATGPEQGRSLIELISAADKRLYKAKAEGRNRICAAPDML